MIRMLHLQQISRLSIGANFKEVFAETVKLNTLDYKLYQTIQQHLIDALDTAEYVIVKGQGANKTNMKVMLHHLDDPAHQSNFENCVADVNIPVGEVFTSPVLTGTEGVLEFWVKPKGTSSIDLDFTLSMRGFSENTNANPVWSECTNVDAVNYLNGHILFFKERVPHVIAAAEEGGEATTEYSYKGLINPSYPRSNITVNEPVEIYWVWADTALQLVSVYDANGVKGIADNTATLTEIQSYLASNQDAVFAVNNDYTSSSISTALNTWWSESATEAAKTDAVNILGKCYNRADSMIGSDIQGALVVLNAEP